MPQFPNSPGTPHIKTVRAKSTTAQLPRNTATARQLLLHPTVSRQPWMLSRERGLSCPWATWDLVLNNRHKSKQPHAVSGAYPQVSSNSSQTYIGYSAVLQACLLQHRLQSGCVLSIVKDNIWMKLWCLPSALALEHSVLSEQLLVQWSKFVQLPAVPGHLLT